jgi:SAM-dependent methyltransferase
LARFGAGDPAPLLAELGDGRRYERVGIDRAMAIAIDMALLGHSRDATILDVGCSLGTIGLLLASIGYMVTGIESDVVAAVQDWQDEATISSARANGLGHTFRFIKTDLRDHLATEETQYDVALLLSVVHHFLEGYGYTGTAQFDRDSVRETLLNLCSRVRRHIYLEIPLDDEKVEMPPDPENEFIFPRWFLDTGQATEVEFIASTIATNGKPRRLYRVGLN